MSRYWGPGQSFKGRDGGDQGTELVPAQSFEILREPPHPPASARFEQGAALGGGTNPLDPPIVGIPLRFDQSGLHQARDQPRHRRRPDLLGPGQLAEGDGAPEDNHGQGRRFRARQAGGGIFDPEPPEQMNGGGMKPGRDLGGLGQSILVAGWTEWDN